MRCLRLSLHQFRSYESAEVTFAPRINLICGPNGSGKTNILEALHYLTLAKSFLTSSDVYAVRKGSGQFEIAGAFEGERRGMVKLKLCYGPGIGKQIFANGVALGTLAEVVGRVPVVLMAPQDYLLTAGPPEERRRFLNNILSQAHPVYLDDLMRYNRALRQRNELLATMRRRRGGMDQLLDSWTEELVSLGGRVLTSRFEAVSLLAGYLEQAYQALGEAVEFPTMAYMQAGEKRREGEEPQGLAARFESVRRREIESGRTLIGPHRDDLAFFLDEMDVRRYASQGQHRTFGVALRLAQFFYLRDRAGQMPLLMLDDLFGSLDQMRARTLEHFLLSDEVGQVLVTHPAADLFSNEVDFDSQAHALIPITESLRKAPVTEEE